MVLFIIILFFIYLINVYLFFFFFFQAEDGIRDGTVTWSSDVCSSDLLVVLQSAIVLVWWAGRVLEGHSRPQGLAEGVDRAIAIRDWVASNSVELVAEALRASA